VKARSRPEKQLTQPTKYRKFGSGTHAFGGEQAETAHVQLSDFAHNEKA
jgi:hypothetical protein